MKLKFRKYGLMGLLGVSLTAVAAVPILPFVPLLLDQVIAYLYPKNQTTPFPNTPLVNNLLAKKQSFVCRTKILVTSPSTVAFYRDKVDSANYLGITKVGHWLQNDAMCIDSQPLIAVTWNETGKAFAFKSKRRVGNINQQLSLVYPQDFVATSAKKTILCQVSVLNNSAIPIALYAEKIASDTRIALLKPYQKQLLVAPCFNNKRILGVYAKQNQETLLLSYFLSKTTVNDINHIPMVEFPRQFKSAGSKQVTLKPDLLKILLALL